MTAIKPNHATTIDQHWGTHEATGLQMFELKEIRTIYSDFCPDAWETLSSNNQEYWTRVIADYHDARVELASIYYEARKRAEEYLLDEPMVDNIEDCVTAIHRSIDKGVADDQAALISTYEK